jgi:Tol biopolymer transport system component
MLRRGTGALACGLTIAAALGASLPAWSQGTTERVSLGPGGVQGNEESLFPAISADGRFVAFYTYASNLVPGDTNHSDDVFVRDRRTGTTERVSVGPNGRQGDSSSLPAISADGRFVAFRSYANNLVPGDTNGVGDVFVRVRRTGTTERVSISSSGEQGNDYSEWSPLSANGRFVAFMSVASNLVPGDTNRVCDDEGFCTPDVFVRDRRTGITERVSISSSGKQANNGSHFPSISADGRFIAFDSDASNLVPGDTNGVGDVFVRDRRTGTTERVSVSSSGEQGNAFSVGTISADGRFIAFESDASNLVPGDTNGKRDVFVRDRKLGTTERVSLRPDGGQGNDYSFSPALSAGGRFVAFTSWASNLVPGDTNGTDDVFVRDRVTGVTIRASISSSGKQGNDHSNDPAISADGRFIAFMSHATNLVPGDTNGVNDIFVRTR